MKTIWFSIRLEANVLRSHVCVADDNESWIEDVAEQLTWELGELEHEFREDSLPEAAVLDPYLKDRTISCGDGCRFPRRDYTADLDRVVAERNVVVATGQARSELCPTTHETGPAG